ncbi:MAG: CotH kinase family protein [Saprospiraceae bacterium]
MKKIKTIGFFLLLCCTLLQYSCNEDMTGTPIDNPEIEPTEDGFAIDVGNSTIPYLVINTDGEQIQNEPKIPAEMTIYVGKEEVQRQTIGIEFRGSTSFRVSNKKSYGIETWDEAGNDVNVSFFDFPEEEDWILTGQIAGDDFINDRTLMYHYFGYNLFRKMGRYASRCKFVEVEINGSYEGVYVFMEKLKRNKNRIPIAKLQAEDTDAESITGGYILKIDKTGGEFGEGQPLSYFQNNWEDDARYTAQNSFRSRYDINGEVISFNAYDPPYHDNQYLETYFQYEYPDKEDITNEQKTYIQDYIHAFETALLSDDFSTENRTYPDFIDVTSFVDFFIINEVCRNVDGYRLSTYMYKDRGDKLNMGPIWDLNIGYDSGDRVPANDWVINYNNFVERDPWMMPFWWPRLLEDPQFKTALKERWTNLRAGVLATSELERMVDSAAKELLDNGSIERNNLRWFDYDYNAATASLKSYLEQRTAWMDGEISRF